MDGGVGVERFAEWVFKTADTYIDEATEGRCFVINVTITEHDDNWASYSKTLDIDTTYVDEEGTKTVVINQDTIDPEPETPAPEPQAPEASTPSRAAQVGPNVSHGKGNWFAGTSWGD